MYSEYDEQRKLRVADQQAKDLRKRLRKRRNKLVRRILCALVLILFIPARDFIRDTGLPAARCFIAERRLASGSYDGARDMFLSAGSYGNAASRAVDCMILKGDALSEAGHYMSAYAAYVQAGDSAAEQQARSALQAADKARAEGHETLAACYLGLAGQDAEGAIRAGDLYPFGRYEQNGDESDGPEPIEWRVLAVENDTILLITEYLLDCAPYDSGHRQAVTWERSSVRAWLNGEFARTAFTEDELTMITDSQVKNPPNRKSAVSGGNDTVDKVYFLSESELLTYLPTPRSRQAFNTPWCIGKGAYTSDAGYGWWWLRSPGRNSSYVMRVYFNGVYSTNGMFAGVADESVRPVIRLDLNALP